MTRWSLSREAGGVKYQMHNIDAESVELLAQVIAGMDGSKLPDGAPGVLAGAIESDQAALVEIPSGDLTVYPSADDEMIV